MSISWVICCLSSTRLQWLTQFQLCVTAIAQISTYRCVWLHLIVNMKYAWRCNRLQRLVLAFSSHHPGRYTVEKSQNAIARSEPHYVSKLAWNVDACYIFIMKTIVCAEVAFMMEMLFGRLIGVGFSYDHYCECTEFLDQTLVWKLLDCLLCVVYIHIHIYRRLNFVSHGRRGWADMSVARALFLLFQTIWYVLYVHGQSTQCTGMSVTLPVEERTNCHVGFCIMKRLKDYGYKQILGHVILYQLSTDSWISQFTEFGGFHKTKPTSESLVQEVGHLILFQCDCW